MVRLYNAGDAAQQAHIGSGLLTIHAAQLCDLSENPTQALTVVKGDVVVDLPARQVTTILLTVDP